MSSHIHLIGIGGMGMGTLAGLLVERGERVTGSDTDLYPPMSDQLSKLGVPIFSGYQPTNLKTRPDIVVVGNVIRRDNPLVAAAMADGIPFLSLPQALQQFFLEGCLIIVVSGTHGKSTTTALIGWLLESAGLKPGIFAGGILNNTGKSYQVGGGKIFVVEGDEYDTAFFDKRPKFCTFRPQIGVLTSAEFDHADIYKDWGAVREAFQKFLATLKAEGRLIACGDDPHVGGLISEAKSPVLAYGLGPNVALKGMSPAATERGMTFLAEGPGLERTSFQLPMWGEHNIRNALAAIGVGLELGVDPPKLVRGLASFQGLRRRQELLGDAGGVKVIDDFAHHPTAIRETIRSVRLRFPGLPLWAIFEPRSNTSRRNVFQGEIAEALATADTVVVASPFAPEKIPEAERLDTPRLVRDIEARGRPAQTFPGPDAIAAWLPSKLNSPAVLVFMSNGDFGGLPRRIAEALKAHAP